MIGRFLYCCLFGFIFFSCGNEERKETFVDEELMIKVPESGLYIRMRENEKGPLLINLHGGPGGFSINRLLIFSPFFGLLPVRQPACQGTLPVALMDL